MIVSVCMFNTVFELMSPSYSWLQIVTIRKATMSQGATTGVYLLCIKTSVLFNSPDAWNSCKYGLLGAVSFTDLNVCCSTQLVGNCELFLDQHQSRVHSLPLLPVSISCSKRRINMQNIVPLLCHLEWQNSPWLLRLLIFLLSRWKGRTFFFPNDISSVPGSKTAHQSLITRIWLPEKILNLVQNHLILFFIQSHLR